VPRRLRGRGRAAYPKPRKAHRGDKGAPAGDLRRRRLAAGAQVAREPRDKEALQGIPGRAGQREVEKTAAHEALAEQRLWGVMNGAIRHGQPDA